MNKKERAKFSKFMQKQEKIDRERQARLKQEIDQADEKVEETFEKPSVALAKTTQLGFFRQYNTYQALLEVHPIGEINAEIVYAKVILYIMRWFRNRLGEDIREKAPDVSFLWDQYPEPERYDQFNLDEISNINGFDFIDFETLFLKDKHAWIVYLSEPDNGNERRDIQGRTFTTEICVYQQKRSVVLGIKESCREPEKNTEDAFGYRPGFVRDIFYDKDLIITEQGLDPEYAFAKEAYKLNGKSGESCRNLYDGLIASKDRQMPILFVPDDYYRDHTVEVNAKTISLLGYSHVVVPENGCRKLFEQIMDDIEFVEVAKEGQFIFYRTNYLQEYPAAYFENDSDEILNTIKAVAQNEPLRKYCDFKEFSFKPSWSEETADNSEKKHEDVKEIQHKYEIEIAQLKKKVNDLERDNDHLQRNISALESENKNLDKEIRKNIAEISKNLKELDRVIEERDRVRIEMRFLSEKSLRNDMINRGMISEVKERYKPLINLPSLAREKKEDLLNWINEYYSDVLVIHPNAEKAFFDDKRNIDLHRLCMMVHYLSGYTKYRNDGGRALDALAARDYDVEDSGYKVEPAGSGQGALEFHRDKYIISIEENGEKKEVLMDLHLKYGKGMDDNMIRVYFYYSPEEKKSLIGYMPGHLPIRNASH